jgi:hypothetical protein
MRELQPGAITVVIPTIEPRKALLERALASVRAQTRYPDGIVVEGDRLREGPATVRNRALRRVETEWTAFLDDDDEFLRNHLMLLERWAAHTGADMVYPWFIQPEQNWDGLGGYGKPFHEIAHELEHRSWIPVTVLAKTQLLLDAGGFDVGERCEEHGLWRRMHHNGANIVHLPRRTWIWHHWYDQATGQGNTSGRTDRW